MQSTKSWRTDDLCSPFWLKSPLWFKLGRDLFLSGNREKRVILNQGRDLDPSFIAVATIPVVNDTTWSHRKKRGLSSVAGSLSDLPFSRPFRSTPGPIRILYVHLRAGSANLSNARHRKALRPPTVDRLTALVTHIKPPTHGRSPHNHIKQIWKVSVDLQLSFIPRVAMPHATTGKKSLLNRFYAL